MQYVLFTPNATAVSDYDVEATYQKLKHNHRVKISSELLFIRFRVGVKEKDIPPFKIILVDSTGQVFKETMKEDGEFPFHTEPCISEQYCNYIMRIL